MGKKGHINLRAFSYSIRNEQRQWLLHIAGKNVIYKNNRIEVLSDQKEASENVLLIVDIKRILTSLKSSIELSKWTYSN